MATAAVAESEGLRIEQAVTEFEALRAGGPGSLSESLETEGGKVELCGSQADPAHVTICYVPHGGDAVLPLAVGEEGHCFARFEAIDRSGRPFWDPRSHPPLVAIIDGARRPFRPMRGRFVVGAVEAPGCVVLLAAVGESLAVIHLAGKARTVVYSGRPLTFSEVDVDRMLRWRRSRDAGPRPAPRVRPPVKVRGYHLQIAGAVEVEVGDGPSIDTVLSHGLRALEWRARTVKLAGRRRRGKTKLRSVLDVFYKVIRAGGGIFEGGPGELMAELRVRCRDFDLDVETFSHVLGLLHAAGTCLVQRPAPRAWRLLLSADLHDPRSDLHRRFCEETVGLVRKLVAGEVLTGASEDAANKPSRAAIPRIKRSMRAGGPSTPSREPGPPATAADTGSHAASDGPTTSRVAEPQSAPASSTATEPADAPRQSGAQAPDAKVPREEKVTSSGSGPASSPPEAEPFATPGPAPAAASTRPTALDLDVVCSNPKLAAESIFSLLTKIGSRLADAPNPLSRQFYELTFTSAMYTCFMREGAGPGVLAEWARRLSSAAFPSSPAAAAECPRCGGKGTALDAPTHAAGPVDSAAEKPAAVDLASARHEASSSGAKQAGAGVEEIAAKQAEVGVDAPAASDQGETGMTERSAEPVSAAAADVDRREARVNEETAERPAPEVPGAAASVPVEAKAAAEDGMSGSTGEQPGAAAVRAEANLLDGAAEQAEAGASAGAGGRLLDGGAAQLGVLADLAAAPVLDDAGEQAEDGADAGAVGRLLDGGAAQIGVLVDITAAPEFDDVAEKAEVGADAGAVGRPLAGGATQLGVLVDLAAAPVLDHAREQAKAGADAGAVGRLLAGGAAQLGGLADLAVAPVLDDVAEQAEVGADAGAGNEVSMYQGTAEVLEGLKAGEGEPSGVDLAPPVTGHEDAGTERTATIDAGRLDGWSNTDLPAGGAARCDAHTDPRTPRRRSLFVPDNCAVLHTQGWSAPFVKAQPVALMRCAAPAPLREPRPISDDRCTVSIATAGPEHEQSPRAPPHA